MNPRVLLRSSRHPGTATGALPAQPRQLLSSSVSQSLVHRLLHSPKDGATPPSLQFQNSFLFAGASQRRGFPNEPKRGNDSGGGGGGVKKDGSGNGSDKSVDARMKASSEVVVEEKSATTQERQYPVIEKPQPFKRPALETPNKGKLLATPSKALKLLLPLTGPSKEPLVLLIHPSQPLSALERLIQAELPPLACEPPRAPAITFKTLDTTSGLVRWSSATQVGEFVAGAKEFVVEIEDGADVVVSAPGFSERSHNLREKLRETTRRVARMVGVKEVCDVAARDAERRWMLRGWAGMVGWWAGVWWLTLGLGVMGPVGYLVGLSTVMGSYLVFLYGGREVEYRAGLGMAVSKRQMTLYKSHGFDLNRWEELVETGKALRNEILIMAEQYGETWNEGRDIVGGDKVKRLLRDCYGEMKGTVGVEEKGGMVVYA